MGGREEKEKEQVKEGNGGRREEWGAVKEGKKCGKEGGNEENAKEGRQGWKE